MEQKPSTPTVELNYEHIYHLRRATKGTRLERAITTVHSNYLAKNYEEDDEGHALVDDLSLDVRDLAFVRMGLGAAKDSIPIDIWTYLYETFDHYLQVTALQPERETDVVIYGEDVEFIDTDADDSDDDIIVTDGGVDADESRPTIIDTLTKLREGDSVVFHVDHRRSYRGEVTLMHWTTTEGWPDEAGKEVVSAHVTLDTRIHAFSSQQVILHAARPLNGDWSETKPVVIDDMEDAGQLEDLQIAENDELWRCECCEKTSYEPDTSRPSRGRQSMEMRVTCSHCGKTDLVEWR